MNPILPVTMQSLSAKLGTELAIRSCAPVAVYMLLKANGYLPPDLSPEDFVFGLDRGKLSTDFANPNNWSRPALSAFVRQKYNASIVSWQFVLNNLEPNISRMVDAGYIKTAAEIEFYQTKVWNRSIPQLVRSGYPVITTVLPGFSTPGNESVHAIIIAKWDEDEVEIVDPDARNPNRVYETGQLIKSISPNGGGTIILPRG